MSNVKCSISAQHEQSIQFEPFYSFDNFIRDVNSYFFAIADHFTCIRISAIRRSQDRATAWQNPTHVFNTKRNDSLFIYEPVITVAYPKNFTSILIDGSLHRSTYHCIKPGRVTTARENTYSLHELSPGRINHTASCNLSCTQSYMTI